MKTTWAVLLAAAAILGVGPAAAKAQDGPLVAPDTSGVPSKQPLPEGWEEIDTRVVFLTTQLASDEASLDAVDKVLRQLGYKMVARQAEVAKYVEGNEEMDRNGGGPVPWFEFYGDTARRFYYHDTPDSTAQLQRPPQFDYIYKANDERADQARQEVAAIGRKIDALVDRKHQLETQQSALWAKIAFRIIASQDLAAKPIYRFKLKGTATVIDPQRMEALKASCDLLRRVNGLVKHSQDQLDPNQAGVYGQMIQITHAAHHQWDAVVIHQPKLALDLSDAKTSMGKLNAALKRMEDAAKNVDDAYRLAAERDKADDLVQKNTSRRLLQAGLIDYAETLLTADVTITRLVRDWNLEPDPARPLEDGPQAAPVGSTAKSDPKPGPGASIGAPAPAPAAARHVGNATIYAGVDDHFRMAINGQQILAGNLNNLSQTDATLKPGDVITVWLKNDRGGKGFTCAIIFDDAHNVISTKGDGLWRQFTPLNQSTWSDPQGVSNIRPVVGAGSSDIKIVRDASKIIEADSIWGDRNIAYLILTIPQPAGQ